MVLADAHDLHVPVPACSLEGKIVTLFDFAHSRVVEQQPNIASRASRCSHSEYFNPVGLLIVEEWSFWGTTQWVEDRNNNTIVIRDRWNRNGRFEYPEQCLVVVNPAKQRQEFVDSRRKRLLCRAYQRALMLCQNVR